VKRFAWTVVIAWLLACETSAPRAPHAPPIAARASEPHAELAVRSIALTYADLPRAETFFRDVLGARIDPRRERGLDAILAASFSRPTRIERVGAQLGSERIELVRVDGAAAHPYRADARSNDLDFQHLALVTRDIDAAYARVRAAGVRPVSTEPQRIPDSNPNAGGIRAFYFRDAEGHPLELIWYPEGRGDARWQRATSTGPIVGIDHSAIAVSNTDASVRFYTDVVGLRVAGTSFNEGTEQERLSGVPGARVRITGLRAPSGPGVELLQYVSPGPGRPSAALGAGDAARWEITISVPDVGAVRQRAAARGLVVPAPTACTLCPARERGLIVRDPDGHLVRIVGG
jgi:catechol 2,3-dioxygenase-like lactoylglutathione lyase family enzyme